jgi:hypothetical protein
VLVIAVIQALNSNAVAQDQAMQPQMHQILHEMSMVMADISNQLICIPGISSRTRSAFSKN